MTSQENDGRPETSAVSWVFPPAYREARETLFRKLKPWADQLLDSTHDRAFASLEKNSHLAYAGDCQFLCTPIHYKGERVDLMSFMLMERRGVNARECFCRSFKLYSRIENKAFA